MRQFPFAHTIEMTHRLRDGALEVATRIDNLSVEPMPVAVGFHPFFQLTDSPRDEWTLSVAAKTHWPVSDAKMPTGVTQPIDKFFADPPPFGWRRSSSMTCSATSSATRAAGRR